MFIHYLDSNQNNFIESLAQCIKNKIPFLVGNETLSENSYLPLRLKDRLGRKNEGTEFIENVYWISTSGTTGLPKYYGISFDSLYETVEALDNELEISKNDIELIYAPAKYSFGLARLASAVIGNRDYFTINNLNNLKWLNINRDKSISLGLNPYMLKVWFDSFEKYFKSTSFKSIKLESGSMPLNRSLVDQTKELLKPKIWSHHYGMTEASRCAFKRIVPSEGSEYSSTDIGLLRKCITLDLEESEPILTGSNIAKFQLINGRVERLNVIKLKDVFEVNGNTIHIVGRIDDLVKFKGSLINLSLISQSLVDEYGIMAKAIVNGYDMSIMISNKHSGDIELQQNIKKLIKGKFGINCDVKLDELIFTETGKLK